MVFEYKLHEHDYLDFQLFTASQSERVNKKKRNGWLLLTIGSFGIALYFYFANNNGMTVYFGFVAIVSGLFYPKYFKWRYKRHYITYNKENLSKRFGQTEVIEIREDSIYTKDKTGEGKINITEIERIDETDRHFFLKISSGLSLIIPKLELENPQDVKAKFQSLGLAVNEVKGWKWK